MVSGLWHGFYPGYIVMFFMASIFVEACKDIFRARILFRNIPSWLNYLMAQFFVTLVMNYFGCTMVALTFEKLWFLLRGTYGFVYIGIPVVFALLKVSGITSYAKKVEANLKAAEKKT